MARLCSRHLQAVIAAQCVCLQWGHVSPASQHFPEYKVWGVCLHEGAAAAAVALWSAVQAQEKVLEEHGVTLEQGLCHGLNSQTHKACARSDHGWDVVESPVQGRQGEAPSQPSRSIPPTSPVQPHIRVVSAALLHSRSRDTGRSWPPGCKSKCSRLGCP